MSSGALSLGHQNERFEPEAFRHADNKKVIPGGIRRGILSSGGPSTPGCSASPYYERDAAFLGAPQMSDFLEAVLREMACPRCSQRLSVTLAVSWSPHTGPLNDTRLSGSLNFSSCQQRLQWNPNNPVQSHGGGGAKHRGPLYMGLYRLPATFCVAISADPIQ